MVTKLANKTQRGHVYAIVDEVDSILIDEARTPLIISGRVADAAKLYYRFASIVRGLQRDVDYEVDEEKRVVAPLEDGIEKVEQRSTSRTSTTASPRTSSTSSRPRSRPRSCTAATRTTSSPTAR